MIEPEAHHLAVTKTARYYTLGTIGPDTDAIWIACHGYGQLAGRFATPLAALVSPARAVVAPEGLHRFYLDPPDRPASERRVGATWMTREDRDHDIADIGTYLDTLCAHLREAAPRARFVALGFSQGAATVCRWVVATRFEPARVVLWGSGPPPDLDVDRARERLGRVPITLVSGDRDAYVSEAASAEHEARLTALGVRVERVRYSGGHALDVQVLEQIARA